jgi:hypothetical protein
MISVHHFSNHRSELLEQQPKNGLALGFGPTQALGVVMEDRINVPGDVGKTHQYRWMGISPLLRQWLEFPGIKTSATVIPRNDLETYERWCKQLLTAAGLTEWPHDAVRHTHALFDYAIRGDFDSVAANLGNSPTISRKHYIAPATGKEAEQFLQLKPEKILRSLELKNRRAPLQVIRSDTENPAVFPSGFQPEIRPKMSPSVTLCNTWVTFLGLFRRFWQFKKAAVSANQNNNNKNPRFHRGFIEF